MRILLVEDEARLASVLSRALREEGHEIDVCGDGESALEQAERLRYDVVLLDWVLPGLDGLEVLRRWRARGVAVPVLLLSARGSVGERVQALRAGADDYLVKPVAMSELCARIEALHRRSVGHDRARALGVATLDARSRTLRGPAGEVTLSARELGLLSHLADHFGDAVPRSELLSTVWGPSFDGTPNVVDVYVGYLRAKLAEAAGDALTLQTVRGVGYRLREAKAAK